MPDTTPTTPTNTTAVVPSTADVQATIQPLATDAIKAEQHIVAMTAAYKAGGASAVAALLPELAPEIEQDYTDIKAALPVIKAGYKTTEFWIVVVVTGFIGFYTVKGTVPPIDGSTAIAALAGVYAVVRGLIKK